MTSSISPGKLNEQPHPLSRPRPHRWMVFSVVSVVYFFVYFHRVSTSVIVSDLLEAFHTNATALGFMSSLYFYLYAFEQPLVGYLSDRIGPRRVIGYWSLGLLRGVFFLAWRRTSAGLQWAGPLSDLASVVCTCRRSRLSPSGSERMSLPL